MKKINTKDVLIFTLIFIISILIFMPFIQVHFSTDTYYIINNGYENYAKNNSLKDGRIIMAFISQMASILNLNYEIYIISLTIFAILTSCVSVVILKNIIFEYKQPKNTFSKCFVIVIAYFTIFNFMFIENMLFVECFVMALSILFYLLSAKTFMGKEKNYITKTLILLIFGIISYQGTISMYLISLLVLSIINKKKVLKEIFLGSVILIIAVVFQLLLIKLIENIIMVKQARISGLEQIFYNIINIIKNLKEILINTGYVFPKYLYLFFITVIFICSIILIKKQKERKSILIEQLVIISFSILFGLSISLISNFGFWSARIRYSIGATIGYIFLHLFCRTDLIEGKKSINYIMISIFGLYAIITTINFINIMNNVINVNKRDKMLAQEVYNYILEYETESNIEVNKIVLTNGISHHSKAYYSDLEYMNSVLSWSAMRTSWSIEGCLEMYTNKNFEQIQANEEQIKFYKKNVDIQKEYLCLDDMLFISYYIN